MKPKVTIEIEADKMLFRVELPDSAESFSFHQMDGKWVSSDGRTGKHALLETIIAEMDALRALARVLAVWGRK